MDGQLWMDEPERCACAGADGDVAVSGRGETETEQLAACARGRYRGRSRETKALRPGNQQVCVVVVSRRQPDGVVLVLKIARGSAPRFEPPRVADFSYHYASLLDYWAPASIIILPAAYIPPPNIPARSQPPPMLNTYRIL